jgi:uncharacterized protein
MSSLKKKYGNWALVTGASSGIGKECARLLAQTGFNLVLVARRELLLQLLAEELTAQFQIETRVVAIDLIEEGAVQKLYNLVEDTDIGLVIPSAGIDEMGRFLEKQYSALQRMLMLNINVPTEIAHVFGKKLATRKRSGIILVSSLFGYQGIPNFAAYAATKSYILTLGEALYSELSKQGIDVLVLSPGLTDTPFSQNMKINFSRLPMFAQNPTTVAKVGLRSIGRKPTVVPGFINKFYAWENRLIPRSWPVGLFGFLINGAIKAYKFKP